jgi:hypothetical protein
MDEALESPVGCPDLLPALRKLGRIRPHDRHRLDHRSGAVPLDLGGLVFGLLDPLDPSVFQTVFGEILTPLSR